MESKAVDGQTWLCNPQQYVELKGGCIWGCRVVLPVAAMQHGVSRLLMAAVEDTQGPTQSGPALICWS